MGTGERCPYSEFFCSVFSRIRTKCGKILCITPYSVRMRENTDQKNSEYGHFLRSGNAHLLIDIQTCICSFASEITTSVTTKLILDEIYAPLKISIRLNVNCIFFNSRTSSERLMYVQFTSCVYGKLLNSQGKI